MQDEHIDRAIDRAVRRIMSADAPADLRRRVLHRLDRPAPTRVMVTWRPALAGLAAVAVLALALAMLWREAPSPARDPGSVAEVQRQPPPERIPPAAPRADSAAVPAPEPGRSMAPRTAANRPRITREQIAMPPVANVFGTQTDQVAAATVERAPTEPAIEPALSPDLTLAPLAPPSPIVIAPLATAPLAVPRIRIDPIDIRRIERGPGAPPR